MSENLNAEAAQEAQILACFVVQYWTKKKLIVD